MTFKYLVFNQKKILVERLIFNEYSHWSVHPGIQQIPIISVGLAIVSLPCNYSSELVKLEERHFRQSLQILHKDNQIQEHFYMPK